MTTEYDDDDDESDTVGDGGMQGAPVGAGVSPTWTWGSSSTLSLGTDTANSSSAQLAQVSLPEPAVCSLYLQAAVTNNSDPANARIGSFTVNLMQGVGRVTVPRQLTFSGQPSNNGPLEFTLPFVALHALQVDVSATGLFTGPASIDLQIYFVLSPITRIPQKIQKLQFGMATPGEADDLDDELREDLEAEGPTAAQAVAEGRRRVDASNDHEREPDDEEEGEEQVQRVPAWLMNVVDQLTRRYGRQPTKPELRAAVKRLQARRHRLLRSRQR